jgi:hypothetical protein
MRSDLGRVENAVRFGFRHGLFGYGRGLGKDLRFLDNPGELLRLDVRAAAEAVLFTGWMFMGGRRDGGGWREFGGLDGEEVRY